MYKHKHTHTQNELYLMHKHKTGRTAAAHANRIETMLTKHKCIMWNIKIVLRFLFILCGMQQTRPSAISSSTQSHLALIKFHLLDNAFFSFSQKKQKHERAIVRRSFYFYLFLHETLVSSLYFLVFNLISAPDNIIEKLRTVGFSAVHSFQCFFSSFSFIFLLFASLPNDLLRQL